MYKVKITPTIEKKLKAILGEKADLSKVSVYETMSNDTRPILGAGMPWKDSRMDVGYLQGMANMLQSGQYVPLIHHHNTYSSHAEGRLFDGKVFQAADGNHELHALFYILDNDTTTTLNQKIDSGIINEVSTQTAPASLKCSACDFDFLASKDNRRKLYAGKDYTPLCENGHQWGLGGNHLVLSGTPYAFKEQSLVLRGAVKGARVLKATEQKLALESEQMRLAASESDDTLTLNTSIEISDQTTPVGQFSDNSQSGSNNMTDISIPRSEYDQLVLAKSKVEAAEAQLAAANTAKGEAETAKQTADAALAAAKTEKDDLQVKLNQAEQDKTAAETKLAALQNPGGNSQENTGNDQQQQNAALTNNGLDISYFKAL